MPRAFMVPSAGTLGLTLCLSGGFIFPVTASPVRAFSVTASAATTARVTTAAARSWQVAATYPAITTTVNFVACGSATHCQAVASTIADSALLGTANGKTWAAEPVPAGITGLGPVSCGSPASCQAIAVSSTGALAMIGTSTGGARWVRETIGGALTLGFSLTGVSCGSATHCQVSGASGGTGALFSTVNGGKTWTSESLPASADLTYAVSCASAADCQAVAVTGPSANIGEIYGTTDGGAKWVAEKNLGSTNLFVISCPAAADCHALGLTGSGHLIAYATVSGGKTWTAQTLPSDAFTTSLSCGSASRCLAVGQTVKGAPDVIETADEGKTWTTAKTPSGMTGIDAVACATGPGCEAVGESPDGIGALAATGDAGRSWSAQDLPLEFYSLNHLACDAGHCQAVGSTAYGGAIVSTGTGGLSWKATALTGAALAEVACGSAARCTAVGGSAAYFTTNGGGTWRTGRVPAEVGSLNAVACRTATDCVAAGQSASAGAVIASSANGGQTWAAAPAAAWSLEDVACGSATRCMAAGETASGAAVVVTTSNSGRGWQAAKLPAGVTSLGAVACGSGADCYVAGRSGGGAVILTTVNGGRTWLTAKLPADVTSVTGLACASPSGCQAAVGTKSGQNVILGTGDGGRTWDAEPLPGGITGLSAIGCGASSCLAAGTNDKEEAVILRDPVSAPEAPVSPRFKAISITWLTPEQGWILGLAPCGASGKTCTEVISTSDGGTTWTQAGTIPALTPPAGNATTGVTEIRFDTPTIGWAFAPDLYRTTNGGRSWTSEPLPGTGSKQVLALATTATAAYAVTSPCAYQGGSCGGRLSVWRTGTLAKESWIKTPLTLPGAFAANLSAFGSTVYADDTTFTANYLYASTDGGVKFTSRPVPCQVSQAIQLSQVVATSASKVDLLCDGNPGFSQAVKEVYRSANTGKTDTSAGTMGLIGIEAQLAVAPSGNLAVASWSDGSFIYINDSGDTTWTMPIGFGDGGLGWNDIVYVTDNEAWVVYSPGNNFDAIGKVLVTHDGGRHWNIAGL